ncbi:MAG: MarR family transcriptional regulator [Propionibacterium sp.]|nr:MarR family transcriptional regulator [Propionibacterium sp.]
MDVLRAHQALSDPTRLGIAQALLTHDLSPGEVGEQWELSTSLVAHHVGVLTTAGLIVRRRGEHDARRSYLSLRRDDPEVAPLVAVGVDPGPAPRRVAFVCTRNSARSKLAAAHWRRISRIPAVDAGTAPAPAPNPMTLRIAERRGLPIDPTTRDVASLADDDLVIVVCDHAHEQWQPGIPRLHWSVSDPVASSAASAFDTACDELEARVTTLNRQVSQ